MKSILLKLETGLKKQRTKEMPTHNSISVSCLTKMVTPLLRNDGSKRQQLKETLSGGGGTSSLSSKGMHTEFIENQREEQGPGGPGSGGARPKSGRTSASKRLRETIDARRSELLPPKSLLIPGTTECTCATFTSCEHCSDAKQKAAEESCRQLRVLFYASTNDIMTMEHSDAGILDLIEKFVHLFKFVAPVANTPLICSHTLSNQI